MAEAVNEGAAHQTQDKPSWPDTCRPMAADGEDRSDLDETVADGLD